MNKIVTCLMILFGGLLVVYGLMYGVSLISRFDLAVIVFCLLVGNYGFVRGLVELYEHEQNC